jgi:pentatricopeptide repeat protein
MLTYVNNRKQSQLKMIPTEVTYLSLLSAFARRVDYFSETFQLFDLMQSEGHTPTIRTYNTLLHACATKGDTAKANEVMMAINEKGLAKDVITYTTFLDVIATLQKQKGVDHDANIRHAERVFESMLQSEIAPTIVTLNTMLNILAHPLRLTRAEKFLQLYSDHGLEPDKYTYFILARMYLNCKRFDKAWEMMQTMKNRGWQWDGVLAIAFAHACHSKPELRDKGKEVLRAVGINVDSFMGSSDGIRAVATVKGHKEREIDLMAGKQEGEALKRETMEEAQRKWEVHIVHCAGCRKFLAAKPFRDRVIKSADAFR